IHTPGHSPGHTSFYLPGMKILFACDLGLDRIGPWYGWKDCSIEAIIESILSLRSMEIKLILTSHGGIIARDIMHSWDRALIHILNREQKIAQDLDMGKPRETIINEGLCYPKKDKLREPIASLFTMWDSVMLDHHMKILDKSSLIKLFPELRTIRMMFPQT
ncbi:MBL fold metallo-hydrolase, partial [archaeon]|nr:MBL fold metallo-hydrolase [archaeon]